MPEDNYSKNTARLRAMVVEVIAEVIPFMKSETRTETDYETMNNSVEKVITRYIEEVHAENSLRRGVEPHPDGCAICPFNRGAERGDGSSRVPDMPQGVSREIVEMG